MNSFGKSRFVDNDLLEIWEYIGRDDQDAADRVIRAAFTTFNLIAANPSIGHSVPDFEDLRFFPVSSFRNYLVFYRQIPSGIEIVRVLHGARNLDEILRAT